MVCERRAFLDQSLRNAHSPRLPAGPGHRQLRDPAADTGGTVVVETRRASGSTSRLRSVLLTQGNPNYTNVTKTLDVINAKPWQIGKVDYRWEVTFAPGELAQRKEGVMVNLGNADGGVIDGRITHELVIDGKPTGHIF